MSKGLKIFLNIIFTIIAVPLCIIGAVFLTPFVLIGLLIALPIYVIEDIWGILPKDIEGDN